ncbi:MAG: hypothetical protein AB2693_17235 [Candidatus Thiodiazotropha sp.]
MVSTRFLLNILRRERRGGSSDVSFFQNLDEFANCDFDINNRLHSFKIKWGGT